jgi:putative ABC transport system permease protein
MRASRESRWRAFTAKLRAFWGRQAHDRELDVEIQDHLQRLIEQFMAQGLSREDAARAARRQFGNITLLKEDRRALQTFPAVEAWWHDLRYASRTVWRSPGFTLVSIVTLGLGIGAAAAIYSVIHNVMVAPFPYRDAHRIVFPRIYDPRQGPEIGRQGYAAAEVLEFVESSRVFEATTAALDEPVLYRHRTGADALTGAHVTPGAFEFFGMPALHGRVMQPDDYEPGATPVFVMSHKAWMERFGGDPAIVNTTLVLNDTPRTLVGIMPPRFGWYGADVYFPTTLTRATAGKPYWFFVGRLRPDVSIQQAEAELTGIARRLATLKLHPREYPKDLRVHVGKLGESVVGRIKPTLYTVLGAVILLLLIACGNVANLMLARATVRQKEYALRTALGAGRARLVRLLIVESLVLAMAGAALGVLLASSGLQALVAALPPFVIPSESEITLNTPVLMVTLGVAVSTALLCGLAPALQSFRRDLSEPLRDGGTRTSGGFRGRRLRDAVIVLEVALSVTLLIGAGLLMRSFVALRDIRLGLQPDHVFTTVVTLSEERYATAEQVRAFLQPLLARVKSLPGVVHAAASTATPPSNTGGESTIEVAGTAPGAEWRTVFQQVTEEYLPALRLELKAGRWFSAADINDARKIAVVNETFVRKYLPNDDPIGRRVRLASLQHIERRLETAAEPVRDAWFEIVGVIGDVSNRGPRAPIEPEMLLPSTIARSVTQVLIVRTSQDPASLTNAVRREVSAIDPGVPLIRPGALEHVLSQQVYAGPRFGLLLMTVFGAVGLILVTVGVYSVLAYSTTEKTHEIGIRMALGAEGHDVLGLIVKSGLRPVIAGLAIGLAMSTLLGRFLSTQLVGVTPYDPRTLTAAAMLLTAIAAIACWIPARRAAHVDPLVALRHE